MRVALLALAVVMTACIRESDDVSRNTPSQSTTSLENPAAGTTNAAPPQTDMPSARIAGAAQGSQGVELNEYSIRMPQTLTAGEHSFAIVNGGKEVHGFEIEGVAKLPEGLPRGNTAALKANLKPGTYTVYCPVPGHKERGMTTTLVVSP